MAGERRGGTLTTTSAPPREAAATSPGSDGAATTARPPRSLQPGRLVAGIVVVGLLLTGLATWATARADKNTEQRLLQTQTRQAAAVLSTAIVNIQQPMASALVAQQVVGPTDHATAFKRSFAGDVGDAGLFVSASLWHREGDTLPPGRLPRVPPPGSIPGVPRCRRSSATRRR